MGRHARISFAIPHAKITVPRVPAGFVRRTRLRARLAEAVQAPVTMLSAPAGYGKTLLLADWIATTGESDKAWISLDSGDNEAGRFWSEVLAAIGECGVVPRDSPLRDLDPPAGPDVAGFLADLIDALDALPAPLFLILDEVHEVTDGQTLHGIETVIRHQPAALRLVLSSRSDPPLPFARLRVQGRLSEMRACDLRFSGEDAARLLETANVRLTGEQLRRLVEQTEGWAAGLRLAARSLREEPDPDVFLAAFASDDHAVADYLVGEVLARFPGETREFLRTISVCDEVTPVLAEMLSGRDDAGAVLDTLERENSLVMGVGRGHRWYRIHPLLRSYLRADLDRRRPELSADLHRIAAAWFAGEENPHQALDHAARADEQDTVVDLLRTHAVALLLNGDHLLTRHALSIAGPAATGDPWLTLISAIAQLEAGDLATSEANLAKVTTTPETAPLGRLVAATHALAAGRPASVVDWHDVVSGQDGPGLEALARLTAGWALVGSPDKARPELHAAKQLAHDQGFDYLVMHTLVAEGAAAGIAGDYRAMEMACTEAVAIAERHGWRRSPWLAPCHVMRGFARLTHLDPAGALEEAAQAAGLAGRSPDPRLLFLIGLLQGTARFDTGHQSAGLRRVQRARRELADADLLPELVGGAALIEYRCALLLRQHASARDVRVWARQRGGATAESSLMTAWSWFARGDIEPADRLVEGVLNGGLPTLTPATRIEGCLLKSALSLRSGRRTRALGALDDAVRLAEPAELIRPFHQADAAVRQLLAGQTGGFGAADAFAAKVRLALSKVDGDGGNGVLTEREHVVLARLPSQRSLDEVASELSVSVNTIKTHVRAIYAKLGVNNRREAVAAARERGLT